MAATPQTLEELSRHDAPKGWLGVLVYLATGLAFGYALTTAFVTQLARRPA